MPLSSIVTLLLVCSTVRGTFAWTLPASSFRHSRLCASSSIQPVLDFTTDNAVVDFVDRLDDAIMGGISTSTVQQGKDGAIWSGVCRTDGGGFCGFRTNAFQSPLQPGNSDGLYVTCRLTSDDEADRRQWKITTRSRPDRGEVLYQAPVENVPTGSSSGMVKIPFDTFKYVRGPRMLPNGSPLDVTTGLFQIGMTMSKFVFSETTKELPNFRDGYFALELSQIGLYREGGPLEGVQLPQIQPNLDEKDKQKQRSVVAKMISPLFKLLFSEQSRRRKAALRILREERKLSYRQAILWGFRKHAKVWGMPRTVGRTLAMLAGDCLRTVLGTFLRLAFFYPLILLFRLKRMVTGKPNAFAPE